MASITLQLLQLLLISLPIASAQRAVSTSVVEAAPSTCPFRTINYITHSLPQQCLPTTKTASSRQHEEVHSAHDEGHSETVSEAKQTYTAEQLDVSVVTTTLHNTTYPESSTSSSVPGQSTGPVQKLIENDLVEVKDNPEEASELESDNFLSFEQWKKQNLKKAGQSEHIARRNQGASQEPRKRPANVHNSLESLGDDGEIDIDFSGFVPGGPQSAREVSQPVADHAYGTEEAGSSGPPRVMGRSRDAGTTCKERFNYASFDCAANVLKTNKEAKSPNTVLLENKDSYMLNQCAAPNKFLILELCNDISIDTVVLANFEFFSSTFRTFRVSVSDRYPIEIEKWKTLGTYEARNTREIQAFLVENPLIWARYVRIEFLTHYGNEFYCPVSLVRIHGKTMIEDWKHPSEDDSEDNEDDERVFDLDSTAIDSYTPDAIAEPLQTKISEPEDKVTTQPLHIATEEPKYSEPIFFAETQNASRAVPASVIAFEAISSVIEPSDTCVPADSPSATLSHRPLSPPSSSSMLDVSSITTASKSESRVSISVSDQTLLVESITTPRNSAPATKNVTDSTSDKPTSHPVSYSSSSRPTAVSSSTSTTPVRNQVSQEETPSVSTSDKAKTGITTTQSQKEKASTTDRTKSGGSPSQAQPATPTMQESFFKSVQKRLQMLEANSSLSLQYIEDQSRALRDAFKKVEQRQLTKTTSFLEQLNQTVLNELRDFRQQYDQLWQSTVIELEVQRQRYERDNEAINARLGILADEVIFQRRMVILQMVLILVCLVLVLFSRGVINNYLELPLVQNVLSKSPSSKWLKLSSAESPARPPQPPRIRSAHQLRNGILKGHRRVQSDDSFTDNQSGTEVYAPPTPVSDYGHPDIESSRDEPKSPLFESEKDETRFDDPEFDPNSIERPSTSPPVLVVNGMSPISDILETSEEDTIETRLINKSNSIPNAESSLGVTTEFVPLGKRLSWDLPDN